MVCTDTVLIFIKIDFFCTIKIHRIITQQLLSEFIVMKSKIKITIHYDKRLRNSWYDSTKHRTSI